LVAANPASNFPPDDFFNAKCQLIARCDMTKKNLPFILIVLVALLLIAIVIWLFERRRKEIDEKMNHYSYLKIDLVTINNIAYETFPGYNNGCASPDKSPVAGAWCE
jgi:cbb3-type cytochrome oxidase subunit 3